MTTLSERMSRAFEDAILATLANPDLQSVIIGDGFGFRSRHETPACAMPWHVVPFDATSLMRDYGLNWPDTEKIRLSWISLPHRARPGIARRARCCAEFSTGARR
jgi:hypothetical protein